jgi:hypothetical protein
MFKIETPLEQLEEKLLSYENFKRVLQEYLQRLLTSDQDTLAVVSEMLHAIKSLSTASLLVEAPVDMRPALELRTEVLRRYGGIAQVEDVPAPDLLSGGVTKVDDPQIYGLSLISTWLDCIISNPEQGLDSLRKVFLRAADPWSVELNRTFHVDLGRLRPIASPQVWLSDFLGGASPSALQLARVTNVVQALGLEAPIPLGRLPLPVCRRLLESRPVYDLTARFVPAGPAAEQVRLLAWKRDRKDPPCLYRLSLDPLPSHPAPSAPVTLGEIQTALNCTLATPIRLEMLEKAEHLGGNVAPTFSALLPLGRLPAAFHLILNHPPGIVMHDLTPEAGPFGPRLLRVASTGRPQTAVRLFRLHPLPPSEWPGRQGWSRIYRFHDLGDLGVDTCPAGAYLQVSLREEGENGDEAEVYFHRWGKTRASLRISARDLRRAAQTGTLIFLGADEEVALDLLEALQGLIGPAAPKIQPVLSQLECQVRWRPQLGAELFHGD